MTFLCWPLESMTDIISLRVQQTKLQCETKTLDNVFVDVSIVVQYQVMKMYAFDAHYKLDNSVKQIEAYVFDKVRSVLPTMLLDKAFEAKEEIAGEIKSDLEETMKSFGFQILRKVKAAMNQINEATRLREANKERAEGEKIMLVKDAEADCDSKKLSGEGVAKQRKAIVDGLRDSILDMSGGEDGTTPKDVIDLLLLTQYFDMLKDIGGFAGTTTIFTPAEKHEMRDGVMQAMSMRGR
jgi:regulator of protease activity HflC (stomatin/prohibitin superfamily)